MSALGQKQTCAVHPRMSAPPKADIVCDKVRIMNRADLRPDFGRQQTALVGGGLMMQPSHQKPPNVFQTTVSTRTACHDEHGVQLVFPKIH